MVLYGNDPDYGYYGPNAPAAPRLDAPRGTAGGSNQFDDWLNFIRQYQATPEGQADRLQRDQARDLARREAESQIENRASEIRYRVQALRQSGQYQQAQLELERGKLQLQRMTAQLDAEIKRGSLALDTAKTAAQLGGPGDYFQALDYYGGQRQNPNLPNWIAQLQKNAPQAGFGAYGPQGIGPAQSLPNIAARLQGQPTQFTPAQQAAGLGQQPAAMAGLTAQSAQGQAQAAGAGSNKPPAHPGQSIAAATIKAIPPSGQAGLSDQDVAALRVINAAYAAPGQLQGGVYESMSPDQQALFHSGGRALGYSPKQFEYDYYRSRPGQGSALEAA